MNIFDFILIIILSISWLFIYFLLKFIDLLLKNIKKIFLIGLIKIKKLWNKK